MRARTWNSIFVFSLLAFALHASAALPPYHLTLLENRDFRDHEWSSALESLRLTEEDLPPYRCDGVQEFQVLPELLHPSPNDLALRIKIPSSSEILVARSEGLFRLNGTRADRRQLADEFVKAVRESITRLEGLPSGKLLLDRLRRSPYPLTISAGHPHFWPSDDDDRPLKGFMMAQAIQNLVTLRWPDYGLPFIHVGAGGSISFNPKLKALFIESDGQKRVALPHIILAHEMFHAFDGIRGLLDRRMVTGEAFEFSEVTEYRAAYFENRIRAESGLLYRKYYGDETGAGGLLGADGEPMLIPAPCL